MSKLSKKIKKVAPFVAPVVYGPTKAIANIAGGKNPLSGLTDIGAKPGTPNPFGVPDLSFLKNPVDLLGQYKSIDTSGSDSMFNDLLNSIKGQNSAENEGLNQTLAGIDEDTKQALAGVHQDALDRGLGGPGLGSDIEFAGLGEAAGAGAKNKAAARTQLQIDQAKRLSDAYGGRYSGGLDTAKSNASIYNDLLKTGAGLTADKTNLLAKLMTDLYSGEEKNRIDTEQPGYLDNFLRKYRP